MLVHVKVTGRVQGVGFRYTTQQKAVESNLTGWVQNKSDGSVELEVEGAEQQVSQFLEEMKAGFHQFIKIKQMNVTKASTEKGYTKFSIK